MPTTDVLRSVDTDATTARRSEAADGDTQAPVATVELADRFLAELSRHRQERPKPLPTQFTSIAEMIVGNRRAKISTSEASQRALAAVNKVAATTGDVIHLARPAVERPSAELTGIIAHELTHVAAPSPAPRFFDDDRHTAEERRASEIGELIRRSPAPPRSGSITTRGGTTPMPQTNANAHRPTAVPSRTEQPNTVRRSLADTISSTSGPTIQRLHGGYGGETDMSRATAVTDTNFPQMLRNNFDLLIELLEDRIISDIERRGGRYRGDF